MASNPEELGAVPPALLVVWAAQRRIARIHASSAMRTFCGSLGGEQETADGLSCS
jgi:hypothetical protein